MRPFSLHIAYVSWGDGGKRRPVLLLSIEGEEASAFRITTKYQDKSDAIQAQYFAISNWAAAGIDKPSYVDTCEIVELPIEVIEVQPIGKLTEEDRDSLLLFIDKSLKGGR